MQAVRTLGQFVEDEQILAWIAASVAEINRHAARGAKEHGKRLRLVVSCTTCTATKTCCWSMVVVRLYEGVSIAGELVRTGRDTPALREELRARAEAMEAATPQAWRTPCLFLDGRERCTVYDVRPSPCGSLFVYTDPALCTTRAGDIKGVRPRRGARRGDRARGAVPRAPLAAQEGGPPLRSASCRAWCWSRSRRGTAPTSATHLRQLPWPTEQDVTRWDRPPAG